MFVLLTARAILFHREKYWMLESLKKNDGVKKDIGYMKLTKTMALNEKKRNT